ncbi:thermonuclease family protein [Falsibacillus pallidus]|uniref:Endonuclease YncB(Thermonuclease family) n=1 Tax=Falsibacillus pallidus TaxID=493781 RepID=A0A370GUT7_9BACI|nr:endonuclease YncB(thermonuclease family) [Falsibacillus pallidus]
MKRHLFVLITSLLILLTILATTAEAHPGARDELGGHFRNADCSYLLHDPTPLAKTAKTMDQLVSLIRQNNSNSKCATGFNASKIDLEGHTLSGNSASTPPASTPKTSTPKATVTKPAVTTAPALQMGHTYNATLVKCTDGDTANFNVNGKVYKTRFLFIDTPESTIEHEAFGKEASEFTCSYLKRGKITLETDGGSLYDKYGRLLAWVFVNGKLEQESVTEAGLVEDFYDYGTYKYEDRIRAAMDDAKENYRGMYASLKPKTAEASTTAEKSSDEEKKKEDQKDTSTVVKQEKKTEKKTEKKAQAPSATVKKEASKTESAKDEESGGSGTMIFGLFILIIVILFFLIPVIKRRPLIAHKMRSKKLIWNLVLGLIYCVFWFIILIIIIIELVHSFIKRK